MTETSFDQNLLNIEYLMWLPWIGPKYLEIPTENRIMVVGESHYFEKNIESEVQKIKDFQNKTSVDYTKRVVMDFRVREYYTNTTHKNFHKTLLWQEEYSTEKFWDISSYHNLIQEPLSSIQSRPSNQQFEKGWRILQDVIGHLQPSTLIFLGNSGSNHIPKSMFESYSITPIQKINGAFAKTGIAKLKSGNKIEMIFLKHPARHYSPDQWHEFLANALGKKMNWLKNQIL